MLTCWQAKATWHADPDHHNTFTAPFKYSTSLLHNLSRQPDSSTGLWPSWIQYTNARYRFIRFRLILSYSFLLLLLSSLLPSVWTPYTVCTTQLQLIGCKYNTPSYTTRTIPTAYKVRKRYNSPCRDLDVTWSFQEVGTPRLQDNRHMKMVRLSVLCTERFYTQGNIHGTHIF
jgi:hypothetical protein